jgi:hypothetical protein
MDSCATEVSSPLLPAAKVVASKLDRRRKFRREIMDTFRVSIQQRQGRRALRSALALPFFLPKFNPSSGYWLASGSPVFGLRMKRSLVTVCLKSNKELIESAIPSKDPWPIRCPFSQLSSMKRMTEV